MYAGLVRRIFIAVVCLSPVACDLEVPPVAAPTLIDPSTLLIPLPPGAPASETTLTFASDAGDYVGQGVTRRYFLGDGMWSAFYDTSTLGRVTIRVNSHFTNDHTVRPWWWTLEFIAPRGQPLTTGTYENARARFPPEAESQPGVSFGGTGRACTTTGQFVISEIRFGPGNRVDRFAAMFEQNCEGKSPALRGEVRIAANPWR